MKILVTGATGFIGSHFVNMAIKRGHKVTGLRRNENSKTRIEMDTEPIWINHKLDEVPISVLSDVDIIVHLAAHSANVPYDNLMNCIYWNLSIPLKLFNKCYEAGIEKFVVAGSCFEYGTSGSAYEYIPSDAPLNPTQSYPASKAAASIAFNQWAIEMKVSLITRRIFQVYGEGEAENRLWPSLCKAALSGKDFSMTKGEQIRDFIHVSQVAKTLIKDCERLDKTKDKLIEIKNLGSGKPMSILDFSKKIWIEHKAKGKLLVGDLEYRKGEVMRYVPMVDE